MALYVGGTGSANKLDDYEEGTFTPGLHSAFNGSYSTQEGIYEKIGSVVHIQARINLSSKGSQTSQLHFTGLPFAISTSGLQYQMFEVSCINEMDAGNSNELFVQNQDGNSSTQLAIYSFGIADGDNYSGITINNVGNSFNVNFRGTYRTSA